MSEQVLTKDYLLECLDELKEKVLKVEVNSMDVLTGLTQIKGQHQYLLDLNNLLNKKIINTLSTLSNISLEVVTLKFNIAEYKKQVQNQELVDNSDELGEACKVFIDYSQSFKQYSETLELLILTGHEIVDELITSKLLVSQPLAQLLN